MVKLDKELSKFFKNNKHSKLESLHLGIDDKDHHIHTIVNPWGDNSIEIVIPDKEDHLKKFCEVINNVILPRTFSAIYHIDKKAIEFIYTAFELDKELKKRKFSFNYKRKKYKCSYEEGSIALSYIAIYSIFTEQPEAEYRNLHQIKMYYDHDTKNEDDDYEEKPVKYDKPMSFWVYDVAWDEELFIGLFQHLNYYMTYYDSFTPKIIIHEFLDDDHHNSKASRYRHGKFPTAIEAKEISSNQYYYWHASTHGEETKKFLHSYQLIEICAHNLMEEAKRKELKKYLSKPHCLSDVEVAMPEIINIISGSEKHDSEKVVQLVKKSVDYKLLWQIISLNKEFFSEDTVFEGGVIIESLINKDWEIKDFENHWCNKITKSLRNIRNALAHGKESRMSETIIPTKNNMHKLVPWVQLISIISTEATLYKDI